MNQKSSSYAKRYFQGNSEARRTEIIKKWGIGFQEEKNLSSLLIFDGNIFILTCGITANSLNAI